MLAWLDSAVIVAEPAVVPVVVAAAVVGCDSVCGWG